MSKIEKAARQLYEETKDMDFLDYSENYDSDIDYIAGLIVRYGYDKTLSLLTD